MKKNLLLAVILGSTFTLNAQFSSEGYKTLKSGMKLTEYKNLIKTAKIKEDGTTALKDGEVRLDLEFYQGYGNELLKEDEQYLLRIFSTSPEARLRGVPEKVVGEHFDKVARILEDKMYDPFDGLPEEYGGKGDASYPWDYYFESKETDRMDYLCILSFDEKGTLYKILVVQAP